MAEILVVEDEGIVGLGAEIFLTSMGHKVISVVASGEEAMDRLKTLTSDVVIMDIMLKGRLTDIATTRLIKPFDMKALGDAIARALQG